MHRILICAAIAVIAACNPALAAGSKPPQATVAEYLVFCSKDDAVSKSDCDMPIHVDIIAISMTIGMSKKNDLNICLPGDGDFPKLRQAVVQWLGEHPDMQSKTADDGVAEAIKALYPCG